MNSQYKNYISLIFLGLFVIIGSQILFHFVSAPDGAKGLLLGFGLGTMIVGVLKWLERQH